MKILHLTHLPLPDWRLEKSALTCKRNGYQIFFGGRRSINYHETIFSKIYEITWTTLSRWGIPYYWHQVKKQFNKIIQEVRPDIIHAHNIFSAKMASEFDIPFIYDDYEYWSSYAKILSEIKISKASGNFFKKKIRQVMKRRAINLWVKWEKELVTSHPTITVSNQIADELKRVGNTSNVFVVPNFPIQKEISDISKPKFHNSVSSVYQGRDGLNIDSYPNRNMNGVVDLFINNEIGELTFLGWKESDSSKIKYIDLLPRNLMFHEMSKHSIGLIPWKKHWSHSYLNPNKYSEYAHAGLYVMCTSSLKTISDTLKDNCMTFDDYDDLASKLKYFQNHLDELYEKRLKIFEFARKNLLWENYEQNILDAYKLA